MRATAAMIRMFSLFIALAFSFSTAAYAATPDIAPAQARHVPDDVEAAGGPEGNDADEGVASVDTDLDDEAADEDQDDQSFSGTPSWLEELLSSLLGDVLDPETLALLLAIIAEHDDNSGPGNANDEDRVNPGQAGNNRGRDDEDGQTAGQNDPTGNGPDDEDGATAADEDAADTVDEPTADDENDDEDTADEETIDTVDEPTADDEDAAGDEDTADEADEDEAEDDEAEDKDADDDENDDENEDDD